MNRLLLAPNGARITGTLTSLRGVAEISGVSYADGRIEVEYSGSIEVRQDSQRAVMEKQQRIFVDEHGGEWKESQLILLVEHPDAAAASVVYRCAYTGHLPQPKAGSADVVAVPVLIGGTSAIVARDVPMRCAAEPDGTPGRMLHRLLFRAGHAIALGQHELQPLALAA